MLLTQSVKGSRDPKSKDPKWRELWSYVAC